MLKTLGAAVIAASMVGCAANSIDYSWVCRNWDRCTAGCDRVYENSWPACVIVWDPGSRELTDCKNEVYDRHDKCWDKCNSIREKAVNR